MTMPVLFLMGPTTAGKTDLAVKLCKHLPVDIISVDSAMVYRGMDIGTAKPSPKVLAETPHRLIDICDPAEAYSAARFRNDALSEIEDIQAHDRVPLLVGGTGLYFRALETGISLLPSADPQIRSRLAAEGREKGWQNLHQRLLAIDPEAAARIHPNDPQRIQRALEVYELTGQTISELFAQGTARPLPFEVFKIALSPQDRGIIHDKVKVRFLQMLDAGLVDEVRGLFERGDLNPGMPSLRMVGYRQIWRFLDGLLDREQMIEHAIVATRQLAKRQLTWLRKEENAYWIDSQQSDVLEKVLKYLGKNQNLSVRM